MKQAVQPEHEVSEGRHSCSGCDSRWFGENIAHCATCHETFSAASTFDKHRIRGACYIPNTCGLRRNRTGVWVGIGAAEGSV